MIDPQEQEWQSGVCNEIGIGWDIGVISGGGNKDCSGDGFELSDDVANGGHSIFPDEILGKSIWFGCGKISGSGYSGGTEMIDFLRICRDRHIRCHDGHGHKHARINWVQVCCPRCDGNGSHFHLGFSKTSGAFSCYRCGKLRLWDVLPGLLNMGEGETRELLREYQTETQREMPKMLARAKQVQAPPGTGPMQSAHKKYLAGRGFDPDKLETDFGLLGTGPLSGKWSRRIIYPIKDVENRVVAYQGRDITGLSERKYLFTEHSLCRAAPETMIYGIERALGESVIIVEGVTGVWRLGEGTVATLGISWKLEQMLQLRLFKQRFVLFDPEPLAQRRAMQLAKELSMFPGSTEVLSGFACDPGDFSDKTATRVRQELGRNIKQLVENS